jgi:hypothetical protein
MRLAGVFVWAGETYTPAPAITNVNQRSRNQRLLNIFLRVPANESQLVSRISTT